MSREESAPVATPALGVSIMMNLGGERQITLQTYLERDADVNEQHSSISRMLLLGDRQKAKYELEGLAIDLAKHEKVLRQFNEDQPRIEVDFIKQKQINAAQRQLYRDIIDGKAMDTALEAVKAQVAELAGEYNAKIATAFEEGARQHHAEGRQTVYEPRGHAKANIDRYKSAIADGDKAIEKAVEEMKARCASGIQELDLYDRKVEAERESALQNMEISKKRYTEEIERLTAEIDQREALIAGE